MSEITSWEKVFSDGEESVRLSNVAGSPAVRLAVLTMDGDELAVDLSLEDAARVGAELRAFVDLASNAL